MEAHNCHKESQYSSLRETVVGLDTISKSTYAHKYMKVSFSHRVPSTCLSHASGSLQGDALQRLGSISILQNFLNLFTGVKHYILIIMCTNFSNIQNTMYCFSDSVFDVCVFGS